MKTGRYRTTAFIMLLILVPVTIHLFMHFSLSENFPTPWPDESHFMWQSISFAEDYDLSANELNQDRPILWMPPVYMVTTGCLFMITGPSLMVARHLSLFFVLAAYMFLWLIVRRYVPPKFSLILCGLFLVCLDFIACGNIARMEAMLLSTICCGFWLLLNRHTLTGLSLFILSPLIHPNGLYFAAAVILYYLISGEFRHWRRQLNMSAILAMATIGLIWIIYGIYVANNWEAFTNDIVYQLDRKASRDILTTMMMTENMIVIGMLIGMSLYGFIKRLKVFELLTLALPAWFIYQTGLEMWYGIFEAIFYMLFIIMFVHSFSEWLARLKTIPTELNRRHLITSCGTALIIAAIWQGPLEDIRHYPADLSWGNMNLSSEVAYVTTADREFIISAVAAWQSASPANQARRPVVQFFPRGDALIFLEERAELWTVSDPLFSKNEPAVDINIIHTSRHLPSWFRFRIADEWKRLGRQIDSLPAANHSRDSTEHWYLL